MKKPFNIFLLSSMALAVITFTSCKTKELSVADKAKINKLTEKVEGRNYTFVARSAIPSGFKSINLDPSYTLRVTKDTIEAYLPYYGRAYTAPIDPTDGGIKFTSTKFDYSMNPKNDIWEIKIDTKDTKGSVKLYLSIGQSGYTTVSVQDVNRQPISFYGVIDGN